MRQFYLIIFTSTLILNVFSQSFKPDRLEAKNNKLKSISVTNYFSFKEGKKKKTASKIEEVSNFDTLGNLIELIEYNTSFTNFTTFKYDLNNNLIETKHNSNFTGAWGCGGIIDPLKHIVKRDKFGQITSEKYVYGPSKVIFKISGKLFYSPFKTRSKSKYIYNDKGLLTKIIYGRKQKNNWRQFDYQYF